uniref:Uncharacterized protein n=1 Tax=viral metagenome TaxID=1070528 RepID=A0A6H1ZWR9_9ZZZZ
MKHTPTPWTVDDYGHDLEFQAKQIIEDIGTEREWTLVGVNDEEDFAEVVALCHPANAALIIEAVNNHHALKHACKLALDALTTTYENGKGVVNAQAALHAFGNLKAALTAVGKEG